MNKTYVRLPSDLSNELEVYAARYGLSKSGFIAYSLSKHINELKYQENTLSSIKDTLADFASSHLKKGVDNENVDHHSD